MGYCFHSYVKLPEGITYIVDNKHWEWIPLDDVDNFVIEHVNVPLSVTKVHSYVQQQCSAAYIFPWCLLFIGININHHQPSSTIINHHQPSSTIINHHQPSSTIINHHQPSSTINHHQPSTIINHHQPSTIINHHQPSTIINHQPSSTIINHQPSSTINHHQPSSTINHHQPSTIINHHQPSTIINHHQPSTIINHHQPSTIINHHQPSTPCTPLNFNTEAIFGAENVLLPGLNVLLRDRRICILSNADLIIIVYLNIWYSNRWIIHG